jgi:ribosomal protein S12 methylthiotransferase
VTKKQCASALRPQRVAFHTLGCAKNTVDSDSFAGVLRSAGFETVAQPHRADVLIVNTCGFLDDAKVESVEVLLEAVRWKLAKPGRRVYAMGCLTQRDGGEVSANIPELDGVFGIGQWTQMLAAMGKNPLAVDTESSAVTSYVGAAGPGSAYLRISDGCSHACAFCAIPQMRGLYRSEPMEDLLREAKAQIANGVREIMLIGQETTSYGVDLYRERRIVELCQRLSEMDGLHWIRILYAHPPTTPAKLMRELARVPKLAPYIDFPIEHASDRMLKAMNRRTTAAHMKEAIDAFREELPEACIRTSVLVGFPGETGEDFETLFRFMETVRFERAGVFTFSPQEGTAGAEMPDPVEEGIALDRLDQIMRLQKQICIEKHQELVGRCLDVLIERSGGGLSWGRSAWDSPEIDGRVRVHGMLPIGQIAAVTVNKAHAYQLDAVPLSSGRETAQRKLCGKYGLSAHSS